MKLIELYIDDEQDGIQAISLVSAPLSGKIGSH